MDRLFHWILNHRWRVLLIGLGAVALAAAGMAQLRFSADYRVYYSESNAQLRSFEALQRTYTKNDNVLFVVVPEDGEVFDAGTLQAVRWLTREAWSIPYSSRVDSVTNFQHSWAEGDVLTVEDLFPDPHRLSAEELARRRQVALDEPLLRDWLVSPRGHVTGVNVVVQLPGRAQHEEAAEVVAHARALGMRLREAHPGHEAHLTGVIMLNNAFLEASEEDARFLVPVMFGVVVLALLLILRSAAGTLVTVTVVALSVAAAMGLSGWAGIPLTSATVSAPTIILTLGVADSVHLLVLLYHGMRNGLSKSAAMIESLRANLQPVFLTTVTTAIGFLSMNFSDSPPFRDLGNIVAAGTCIAFLLTLFVLPALVMVLPAGRAPATAGHRFLIDRLADFVVRRRGGLLWGLSLLMLGLAAMIPRNELNDEYVKYLDEQQAFRRATELATEHLTGVYSIEYSLPAAGPGGIAEPDYLEVVDRFARWFRTQPEVLHVAAVPDILKRLNKNMHGDAPQAYRIPQRRDLAAQYLLLYELSLPYGLDLNDRISIDRSATRLVVTLRNLSSREFLGLEARAAEWLAAHAPPEMRVAGSSPTSMFTHISDRNLRSMLKGTTFALVLISLLLAIALRSVKIGFVALLPNLAPAAMAFGLWGITSGQVGLSLSIVTGMTLGIIVDNTIHFLSKYLRGRRRLARDPIASVRYAFSTVGEALVTTTIVLFAGFLVLCLSSFEVNAGMGLLTSITLVFALTTDLLLLPPLLIGLDQRRGRARRARHPAGEPAA